MPEMLSLPGVQPILDIAVANPIATGAGFLLAVAMLGVLLHGPAVLVTIAFDVLKIGVAAALLHAALPAYLSFNQGLVVALALSVLMAAPPYIPFGRFSRQDRTLMQKGANHRPDPLQEPRMRFPR